MPLPPPLLPLPTALVPPLHALLHLTRAYALKAAPSVSTVSSLSLGAILAREAWKRLPSWIKNDVAFRNLEGSQPSETTINTNTEESNEMATLNSILQKLNLLAETGSTKLECPLYGSEIHVAVLAYFQLASQVRERWAEERDVAFGMCVEGGGDDDGDLNAEELKEALDFAVWAYDDDYDILRDKLEERDFYLIRLRRASLPGYVGHFVAICPERRTVLIGVKGTSTLEDMMTDCCGRAVTYNLSTGAALDDQSIEVCSPCESLYCTDDAIEAEYTNEKILINQKPDDTTQIRCHEGILISSRRLADDLHHLIAHLAVLCRYKLLICGHSLGAGAAALLALILRSRFPSLQTEHSIRVVAFASPPVLDYDGAMLCSPFVTTIVNNSDIIPRSSLANLTVFCHVLCQIHRRLDEKGMNPNKGTTQAAAFLKKLFQGTSGDMILSYRELQDAIDSAQDMLELRDPDHLYVPGRVLLLYENWNNTDGIPNHPSSSSSSSTIIAKPNIRKASTYGTTAVLRYFEVNGYRMFTDHLTTSYYTSVDALSSSNENEDCEMTMNDNCRG